MTKPPKFLINIGLGLLLVFAMCLTAWGVTIFRKTIIPVSIPLFIWLLTGILLTPVLRRFLNTWFLKPGSTSLFLHFFYNIFTWGGIALFGFMFLNYTCASRSTEDVKVNILSYGYFKPGSRGGCGKAFAVIDYKGQTKELVFNCSTPIEQYKLVHLKIAKGLWGFEVIKDVVLIPSSTEHP